MFFGSAERSFGMNEILAFLSWQLFKQKKNYGGFIYLVFSSSVFNSVWQAKLLFRAS
jgi:hypothetical protein